MTRRRKTNSQRPRPRRQIGSLDGKTMGGGCPTCSAELTYHHADHRLKIEHDDACPVLAGDLAARIRSTIAVQQMIDARCDEPFVIFGRLTP